jgi:hypothetical protein
MNMHSTVSVRLEADALPGGWNEAIETYRAARAASDDLPDQPEDPKEAAIEDYCRAMDHLIDNVPAPNIPAVITKLELMRERYEGLEVPPTSETAVMGDLRRLAAAEAQRRKGALILALHARYEAVWEDFNRLDEAQPAQAHVDFTQPSAHRHYYACERGKGELADEAALVRRVILRQVPSTDEEVTIMLAHLWGAYDAGEGLADEDRKAIEVGLVNVLDYMVAEGRADMELLGKQFTDAAMIAWSQRRHREGETEAC